MTKDKKLTEFCQQLIFDSETSNFLLDYIITLKTPPSIPPIS